MKKNVLFALSLVAVTLSMTGTAFAQTGTDTGSGSMVAIGAGLAVGLAILGAALAQSKAASSALDSIGRNPSASDKIFTPMILSFVFIEALGILGFVIAFFLQGKVH
jgi:F-type H+-transporting ATPase subunit c